jgi:hypothetical protein
VTSACRRATVALATVAILGLTMAPAAAHEERRSEPPSGSGTVPTYRQTGPQILVCKSDQADFQRRIASFPADLRRRNLKLFEQCQAKGMRNVQEAVEAATSGTRILVLPGVYREAPSLSAPSGPCSSLDAPVADLGYQILSWAQQVACPHNQNLIAVLGKHHLQIEGTGANPQDVILDAQYRKLNTLRADRADGVYLRNFTAERSTFNAIYVMETDGLVIDHVIGRWADGYGFLTFTDDHGLYTDCEAYGNGESGIYPGAPADLNADRGFDISRYAIEIRYCRSHHNLLGYSGTAGDSVWTHDNEFFDNTAGVSMDSAFPDHPGQPQNHAKFERNDIHDNNTDYYRYVRDGTCTKPSSQRGYEHGVVCPEIGIPRGAGVITAGGNFNVFSGNWVYGQRYSGFVLFWVPSLVRGEEIGRLTDTSHHNRYLDNHLGVSPSGERRPNKLDVWWDGQGRDNRWQSAHAEPVTLPGLSGLGTARLVGEPFKLLKLADCSGFDLASSKVPAGCDWYGAKGISRIEVRAAAIQALLLIAAAALLLWRKVMPGPLAILATAVGMVGAAIEVIGVAVEGTRVGALASLLLATWWLTVGWMLRREGQFRGLAGTALALGGLTTLQAIDRGVWMLPFIPISLSWPILVIGLNWIIWVLSDPTKRTSGRARRRNGRSACLSGLSQSGDNLGPTPG